MHVYNDREVEWKITRDRHKNTLPQRWTAGFLPFPQSLLLFPWAMEVGVLQAREEGAGAGARPDASY
jgi:hypothetical protein